MEKRRTGGRHGYGGYGHVWNSRPFFDCNMGHQGAEVEDFLGQVQTWWYEGYMRQWLTEHGTYCTAMCARCMIHDGNGKTYRTGCPAEVAPEEVSGVTIRRTAKGTMLNDSGMAGRQLLPTQGFHQRGARARKGAVTVDSVSPV